MDHQETQNVLGSETFRDYISLFYHTVIYYVCPKLNISRVTQGAQANGLCFRNMNAQYNTRRQEGLG